MAGFITTLVTEKIEEPGGISRARWRLLHRLEFHSDRVGKIVVPPGFVTDFASVPRTPLLYWLFGDTAHASAVVHDYLVREWVPLGKITWREAAEIFGEAMRAEGVPAWRRWMMQQAVSGPDDRWDSV